MKQDNTPPPPRTTITTKSHSDRIAWLETLCSFQIARSSLLKIPNTMFRKCCKQKAPSADTKFENCI